MHPGLFGGNGKEGKSGQDNSNLFSGLIFSSPQKKKKKGKREEVVHQSKIGYPSHKSEDE